MLRSFFAELLDPLTLSVVVLAITWFTVARLGLLALQRSERERERLHNERLIDAQKAADAIREQRDYHAQLRAELYDHHIQLRDTLHRATDVIERCEQRQSAS